MFLPPPSRQNEVRLETPSPLKGGIPFFPTPVRPPSFFTFHECRKAKIYGNDLVTIAWSWKVPPFLLLRCVVFSLPPSPSGNCPPSLPLPGHCRKRAFSAPPPPLEEAQPRLFAVLFRDDWICHFFPLYYMNFLFPFPRTRRLAMDPDLISAPLGPPLGNNFPLNRIWIFLLFFPFSLQEFLPSPFGTVSCEIRWKSSCSFPVLPSEVFRCASPLFLLLPFFKIFSPP